MRTHISSLARVAPRKAWSAVVIAAASLLVAATPPPAPSAAHFHVALTKAEPGFNDTVSTSPSVIKLWFSEPVQTAVTGARLIGPNNHMVQLGAVHVDPGAKAPVVVAIGEKLESGKYTVAWKTMAEDGHPASGTFTFVVRIAAKRE